MVDQDSGRFSFAESHSSQWRPCDAQQRSQCRHNGQSRPSHPVEGVHTADRCETWSGNAHGKPFWMQCPCMLGTNKIKQMCAYVHFLSTNFHNIIYCILAGVWAQASFALGASAAPGALCHRWWWWVSSTKISTPLRSSGCCYFGSLVTLCALRWLRG